MDLRSGFLEILGRLEVESPWARVAVALAASAVALLARLLLAPLLGDSVPFLLYFPTIVVAASVGGHWTGLLTVLLCALGHAALFEAPSGTRAISDAGELLQIGLFVVTGEVIAMVTGASFDARRAARRSQASAQHRFEEEALSRRSVEAAEKRTRVLYETAAALADALTPEDVATVIIRQGMQALGAGAGAVLTVNEERTRLRILRSQGYPEAQTTAAEHAALDGKTATSTAILTCKPVFLPDRDAASAAYPAMADAYAASGTQAFAAVPLGPEATPIGVFVLSFPRPLEFPPAERDFIMALGHECTQALERARLYRSEQVARHAAEQGRAAERLARAEAEEARLRVALLADVSAALSESMEYETTLQHAADLAIPLLGDWMAIDLVRPDGSVRSVAQAHVDPDGLALLREYRHRFPPDQHRSGSIESIRTGQVVLLPVVPDEEADGLDPELLALAARLEIRSYLSVPLKGSGSVLGALAFGSRTSGLYGPAEQSIAEDIARRAAAAIEHSTLFREARQFIATVDATLDAVFMFEPATLRFTYVNQGAIAQVGYDRAELLTMRAIDIKPDFDEARYRQLLAPLIDGSRDHLTFSTVHRHREGFDIPVEAFLQYVRLPGGAARMIITSRDIRAQIDVQASLYRLARSERSRAAELSAVIQGMSDGVLVCDADGRVVLANHAAATILGDPVDGYAELIARLDGGEATLPALGTSAPPVEVRLRGQDRWIEIASAQVATDPTDPVSAGSTILVVRDVTAARHAQAAREAFIGVLSHELRTPITTIYGNTKVLRRVSDPDVQRQMLGDIETEADRLYRLVEDLLILSRAETGIRLEGEPILLQHLIPTALASERTRWPGHTFLERISPGLSPVAADRTYLDQVIRNLITNAAKYGGEQGVVEVQAALDPDGEAVSVRVLDDGPGVPEGEEERVFELFFRSDSTARSAGGAGIGLYVCRMLVEGMGGRIWTRRRPGGGGEFGFTIPILTADDEEPSSDDETRSTDEDPDGGHVPIGAGSARVRPLE